MEHLKKWTRVFFAILGVYVAIVIGAIIAISAGCESQAPTNDVPGGTAEAEIDPWLDPPDEDGTSLAAILMAEDEEIEEFLASQKERTYGASQDDLIEIVCTRSLPFLSRVQLPDGLYLGRAELVDNYGKQVTEPNLIVVVQNGEYLFEVGTHRFHWAREPWFIGIELDICGSSTDPVMCEIGDASISRCSASYEFRSDP